MLYKIDHGEYFAQVGNYQQSSKHHETMAEVVG